MDSEYSMIVNSHHGDGNWILNWLFFFYFSSSESSLYNWLFIADLRNTVEHIFKCVSPEEERSHRLVCSYHVRISIYHLVIR